MNSEQSSVNRCLIVPHVSPLYASLEALARGGRLVFFAGLPGTGKSLLINQLAHIAHANGRRLTLLQWDIARPVFEASAAGQRYPQAQGVTHGMIRMAVGRWARRAVTQWHEQHPSSEHLLIGETPFIGHRLIELARPADDGAESVLTLETTRFVVPVPSREVRQHLEAERERRAQKPLHPRETEDAPPAVLRDLWRQLVSVARALNITDVASDDAPYDPLIYERVYSRILRHRRTQVLRQDVILPTATFSAYNFNVPGIDLTPSADDVTHFIRQVEEAYPDRAALQREIERWYVVSEQ